MTFKVGIDVGGTFTDLCLWQDGGNLETFKVLSTPRDPSEGVLDGIRTMAESRGLGIEGFVSKISHIVHGTTVTTNAVLTRNGARTGLLTTQGVRDALEMRRGIREEQYNNRYLNVVPLIPRKWRLPIPGRMDYKGEVLEPLDLAQLRAAVQTFKDAEVSAVVICFMNAFANPAHEQQAAAVVRELMPEAYLSVSSDVLPTIRFYNRVSTTTLNAYIGPVLRDYLGSLTDKLEAIGFGGVLLIMQSNGGVARPSAVLERPAMTLLSGPAAGPRASLTFAEAQGHRDCMVVDMGGTSFDASLVRNGAAELNAEGEIDRLRIALPMLAIATIGAGGGSIGWIDEGGLLRMGPQSAGALPGPACYGRGGTLPTCTDANLLLGYLAPEFFAGGKLPLSVGKAHSAISDHIATPLGMDVEAAAAGMYRVINANMAHGVREITVRRGLDPREFPLVVAGGAGALHACSIARELDVRTILVPATASTLCATGMLLCDLQHDFLQSCVGDLTRMDLGSLSERVRTLMAEGEAELKAEGADQCHHQVSLDLRYLKQYHELTLPIDFAHLVEGDLEAIASAFHTEHNRLYGYDLAEDGDPLELINLRVRSIGDVSPPSFAELEVGGAEPVGAALKGARQAYVPEADGFDHLLVYDGHQLLHGNRIPGPALIERVDTTILVSAGYEARVDRLGTIVMVRT